ncbi:hypothetical protein Tco_0448150 [Tanacetum coccineum]
MVDHFQLRHEGASSRRKIGGNSDGLIAITAPLSYLGRETKKLFKWVYSVRVKCELCNGYHLSKDCPQKEQVKEADEIYYGELYQMLSKYPMMMRNLEDLLKNKSMIDDEEKENMNEWCSVWLENTLTSKEKDPGNFTLPCLIGQYSFSKSLTDLGASIDEDLFTYEIVVRMSDVEFLFMRPRLKHDGIPWTTPEEEKNRFA